MANLKDCLQSAIDAGASPGRVALAQQEFDEVVAQYETAMPRLAAEAAAKWDIAKANSKAKTSRRHAVLSQLQAMRRNEATIGGASDPAGEIIRQIEGLRHERDGIGRQVHGAIGAFLHRHGKNLIGNARDRTGLVDVVRELHGQASGNATSKAFADAIRAQQTRLRTLFNAHGGDIGELADFGLPHSHDAAKIRKADRADWIAYVKDRADWSRIEDHSTGKPFGNASAPGVDAFLGKMYERVTTRGAIDRSASMQVGGKALYNRRAEPRVLHFRDADAWMEYNDQFGATETFDAILGHLDGMAADVAMMRTLGPNPRLGLEHMIQVAENKASVAKDVDAEGRISSKKATAKAMLSHLDGSANSPANHAWAAFFAGTRQVLTAAQLGGAVLSASTDLWTQRMAAKAVGMNGRAPVNRAVQLMASKSTRETAAAMGYVADTLADAGNASARFLGDTWSPEVTQRISNFVLRASGLSYWTDMNRVAFQMEFAAHLAQNTAKDFGAIDPLLRETLTRGGITAADWDLLRVDGVFTAPNGSEFLSPKHWLEAQGNLDRATAEGLSIRLQAVMQSEMEFAVPSVSLEGRSAFIGDGQPGTVGGEILRSAAMYKNYALSLTLNQVRRTAAMPTGLSRARYAATLMGGLTIMGAISVQLKELAKGRDPRPMTDAKFWGAASLQGGGVGIFGDFFASESSRAGGGFAETLAGPVAGVVGDVTRAVSSNVARIADGKDPLIGRDAANLTRRYTPGTSLWYARLALDRMVWDNLQDFLDPEARVQARRAERRRAKKFGNDSWWAPQTSAPSRAPDFTAIGGSS